MSRINASAFTTALLSGKHANIFPLLEMRFSSGTQYFCGLGYDVPWNGNTYLAAGGLLSIGDIVETPDSAQGLEILLSGARPSDLSLVANERVQNRRLIVRLATLDVNNALVVDSNVWTGSMDMLDLDYTSEDPKVSIRAEHYMILWDRPRPFRYTDAAQKALWPNDRGLEYVAILSQTDINWPTRDMLLKEQN